MWRFCKQCVAILAVAAAGGLWCLPAALAKGPGQGTPAGTVYFRHIAAASSIWSMKADGSELRQYPAVEFGEPSYLRHSDQRWFVMTDSRPEDGEYFPDVQPMMYVLAVNENGQTTVPLVWQNDLAILTAARWTPGETPDHGSVSFIAERWGLDTDGLPIPGSVTEAGLYAVDVDFANGSVVPSPPRLVVDLKSLLYVDETGMPTRIDGGPLMVAGSVAGHSWAPGQTAFTFAIHVDWADGFPEGTRIQEIWIVDLTKVPKPPVVPPAALKLLASDNGIGGPEWSPDGSCISYNGWDGKVFHQLSSGRKKILRDNPFYGWGPTRWSPDGKYFVTHRWDKTWPQTDGIYRFAADLTGQTLLTAGFVPPGEHQYLSPVGWRD